MKPYLGGIMVNKISPNVVATLLEEAAVR